MALNEKRAYLVLADGTVFTGVSMGVEGESIGEVVYNTCADSYQEILTDPTYYGQLVAQTYPLVGNRGLNCDDSRITANGYIVREWCNTPEQGGVTLDEYLKTGGVVGISGIDTRRLTRKLRDKGYFNGAITTSLDDFDGLMRRIKEYSVHGAVAAVTTDEKYELKPEDAVYNMAVLDLGFPQSMLTPFLKRGCALTVYPASASCEELLSGNPDAVIFPDGPGDPDDDISLVETIKSVIAEGKPVIGIGVGHQMMALAVGGRICKMPKGHRGSNQPVRIAGTDKIMVTVQNHGYDVDKDSISSAVAQVTLTNVNDNSVEGLKYLGFPGMSVQFVPGDNEVYSDSSFIYDEFIQLVKNSKVEG
ncbi:MAG: glutamine-hydrolyzing carbamoyl-phosphate synthase small subunit [Clostridia bacterium]|nr:glutamine-hydrolyzing carbamoyl-phosphate synthase small subunit [Clostridia bacterium]